MHAVRAGGLMVILYIACILWQFTMLDPEVMNFHLLSLKTLFPGFQGYDVISMTWGAILSFGYGFGISVAFHSFHEGCCLPKGEGRHHGRKAFGDMHIAFVVAGAFILGIILGAAITQSSMMQLRKASAKDTRMMQYRDGGFQGMMDWQNGR